MFGSTLPASLRGRFCRALRMKEPPGRGPRRLWFGRARGSGPQRATRRAQPWPVVWIWQPNSAAEAENQDQKLPAMLRGTMISNTAPSGPSSIRQSCTPTTLDRGWMSCARTTAPSSRRQPGQQSCGLAARFPTRRGTCPRRGRRLSRAASGLTLWRRTGVSGSLPEMRTGRRTCLSLTFQSLEPASSATSCSTARCVQIIYKI